MTTNETARSRRTSLAWSAVSRAARLLIFGFIGWFWFVWAADFAWKAVSLAAVLAVAALVSITWYVSRARARAQAERRWRAALDAYAEKELAKRTNSRRKFHARPQT
jgi:4-amino-4-deoxy-L-arabinose transferase-like glycosyltransferase